MKRKGPLRFVWHLLCWALLLALAPLAALSAALPLNPTLVCQRNLRERLKVGWFVAYTFNVRIFLNYAVYFVETILVRSLDIEQVENQNELTAFLKQSRQKFGAQKGFLFLSAHLSNIEAAGEALQRSCLMSGEGRYVVLAKPADTKWIQSFLTWMRQRRGLEILWTDRKDLLREMMKVCQGGNSLGLLVDQKPSQGGIFVQFFDRWAAFPVAGPELCVRAGMIIVHVCAVRTGLGKFRMEFAEGDNSHLGLGQKAQMSPIHWEGLAEKERKVAPIFAAFAFWLEDLIRQFPTQWFWDYRKWSRQPKGPLL